MKHKVGKLEYGIVQNIINTVCDYYELDPALMPTKKRSRDIVHARQLSCYLIRKYTEVSKLAIGRVFFSQDHSTVIHSCNVVEREIKTNARGTKFDIKNLSDIIEGKVTIVPRKFKTKYGLHVKCSGMKDEYYGFWDTDDEANTALQDQIKSIIKDKRCVQSSIIKIKAINNE